MKILTATHITQGQHKDDFCWIEEGEPLTFSTVKVDGWMIGMNSRKGTTTFKVVETELTKEQFTTQYITAMKGSLNWLADDLPHHENATAATPCACPKCTAKEFSDEANQLLEIASRCDVGDIMEMHGSIIRVRQKAPDIHCPN